MSAHTSNAIIKIYAFATRISLLIKWQHKPKISNYQASKLIRMILSTHTQVAIQSSLFYSNRIWIIVNIIRSGKYMSNICKTNNPQYTFFKENSYLMTGYLAENVKSKWQHMNNLLGVRYWRLIPSNINIL